MSKILNGWKVYEEDNFVEYYGEIPTDQSRLEDMSKTILSSVLSISDKYQVCKICPDMESSEEFLDFLKRRTEKGYYLTSGVLEGFKYYHDLMQNPATLLYYYDNDGTIKKDFIHCFNNSNGKVEGIFNNIEEQGFKGDLEKVETYTAPITLSCFSFEVNGSLGIHIHIYLKSDIWLPVVNDFVIESIENDDFYRLGEVDNHDLAKLNTPRLNSFLLSVKELVLKFNGNWSMHSEGELFQKKNGMRRTEKETSTLPWCDHGVLVEGKMIYEESNDEVF